jgi:hypothetical protein
LANFDFTPKAGDNYKAIIKLPGYDIHPGTSGSLEQGYVLRLNSTSGSQLHLSVTTNKPTDIVYLFVHTRQVSEIAERGVLVNGSVEFTIDKNKLAGGISHITIFDRDNLPVCEDYILHNPDKSSSLNRQLTSRKLLAKKSEPYR